MADCLAIESACVIFQAAVIHDQKELRKRALTFIEENTESVFNSERFNDLTDTALAVLLRSDLLQLDEIEVLDKVKKWAKTNAISSGQSARKIAASVIHTVRLALLDQEELSEIETENDETHFIPVDMLAQAWKLHALKSKTDKKLTEGLRLRRGTKTRDIHAHIALAANKANDSDSDDGEATEVAKPGKTVANVSSDES